MIDSTPASRHTTENAVEIPLYTLAEIAENGFNDDCYQSAIERLLSGNSAVLSSVTRELDRLGFRRFSVLGRGSNALVLTTTDNQLVRLSRAGNTERLTRPSHPAILEALFREILPVTANAGDSARKYDIILEVLPKINPCYSHRNLLASALRLSGLQPYDIHHTGNVGEIEFEGKTIPLLIDVGLIKKDYAYTPEENAKLKKALSLWLTKDGEWIQRKWLKAQRQKFDLMQNATGLTGAIPREQVENLDSVLRGPDDAARRESQTVKALNEDGMYEGELADLYDRAAKRIDPSKNQNFSELLKEERIAMKAEKDLKR
jgi:hypothetical protein